VIDAETYAAVEQLQRAYADVATRGAWDEVRHLLTEDAHITFTTSTGSVFETRGPQAFAEFGAKMPGFDFFEYIPLNFVVSRAGDGRLVGRTYSLEVIGSETGEWIESYSAYEDTYVQSDGQWRFARRIHKTVKQRTTKQDR
jgi:SnoaL-like domain